MDDVWGRLALVVGALIVAGAFALLQRRRGSSRPERPVEAPGFDPGVYFFSSSACPTCAAARGKLDARLGERYVELTWEGSPGVFAQLEIDAVPAVMVVDHEGAGRLFMGQPDRALRRV